MDIYEALGKLRENKKVDRVAQRKKLVEKKLNEYSEPAEVWSPFALCEQMKNYLFNMLGDLRRDGKIKFRKGLTMTEVEAVFDEICEKIGTLLSDEKNESIKRKPAKRLNESRRTGKKPLRESLTDDAYDLIEQAVETARDLIKSGSSKEDAISSAIDDALMYYQDIVTLAWYYDSFDYVELRMAVDDDLYSDIYERLGEDEEEEDEEEDEE